MDLIREALHNYLFLIPLFVLFCSELTKIVVEFFRTGLWHRRVFGHGGFPSSHSAFVTSLLIVVERKMGLDSVEFAIAAVFACIVWYDAVAVRGSVGRQAKVLNTLQDIQKFSEEIGHSLAEVIAGVTFGALITAAGIWMS